MLSASSPAGAVSFEDGGAFHIDPIARGVSNILAISSEGGSAERIRATTALVGDIAWVFIDGEAFEISVEDAQQQRARRRDRGGEGALAAPMPATVARILVETGQTVASGETLLLLEAMKMEMPIKAPHAGRVAAIRCQAGELVQPGIPLLDLEIIEG